jgi:hypothetical protein
LFLYVALSGDRYKGVNESGQEMPDGKPETRSYFEFKREHLKFTPDADKNIQEVLYIQDPYGNPYGYSTAGVARRKTTRRRRVKIRTQRGRRQRVQPDIRSLVHGRFDDQKSGWQRLRRALQEVG